MNALGARVRLVKGAYKEPRSVAYQKKADVDAAFLRIMQLAARGGHYPAIATHDPAMIDATRAFARERALGPDRFEFQMLYGIRRDLQASLREKGYRVRVYVPFGREWFPYFMRRLGERPANVAFVIRSVLRERQHTASVAATTPRGCRCGRKVCELERSSIFATFGSKSPEHAVFPARKLFCSAWHIS